ncbi:MAG: heme-copper oxidase subunit III [Synechococcus sp. MED650]|nr:heme-copper oxidase subunit III [Synechococcus sp. MED650]MEC8688044.1 cytochrome c oxidase subunit 3 [Cyanobacteriota bacterium]|tara:strand:- start:300 stop:905 length:606 start_codon:yes stop_codon:yes gene_type:complete
MTTTLPISEQDQSHPDSGHEDHPDHRMFGLATFLVADAMTFAGFFAAYLTFKAVNPLPDGAIYELELPLPILNTILLLVSSATFHKAGQAIRKDDHSLCRRWLLITAGLGIAFLVSQMVEYFTLPFGLTDNLYASTFFAATGFHGLHVTLGALMTLIVWWQARQPEGRLSAANHFPLEAAELYWHFVDGIWVVLFVILYLL